MIVAVYNNGWGLEHPSKRLEHQMIERLLSSDSKKTVVVNSVWYTDDFHQEVLSDLKNKEFDRIALVGLLDPPIVNPTWFQDLGCEIISVGYYPGPGQLDYWAVFMDEFFTSPDHQSLLDPNGIDTAYLCYNRKPHPHRMHLYRELDKMQLLDQGLVTMGSESGAALRSLEIDTGHDDLAPNASSQYYGLPNDIASLGHLGNWTRCFLNLVTETTFDINDSGFVSEKIYKPILGCRPFLVYARGATEWLQNQGFQTFEKDFRDITDLEIDRPEDIPSFIKILCQQPAQYWRSKFVDLQEKIIYNKENFQAYVGTIKEKISKGI